VVGTEFGKMAALRIYGVQPIELDWNMKNYDAV